jgi:2-polyprenyl-3-methyl-5-hydroxy-6-metoxy-1,4-benzoquinol methylase
MERTISGLHQTLIQELPALSYNSPILDIGCGTGAWLERVAAIGFHNLYGIDLDVEQVKTKKAQISKVDFDQDNFEPDCEFGLITAIEVIEHLENPGRLFHFVQKHLGQEGYFLITTPNIHSLNCRLKFFMTGKLASFDEKGDKTHIYPALIDALHRVLPHYSLQITRQWTYPQKGSLIYRRSTQMLSQIFGMVLPNPYPGDTLCLLLQKQ